MRWLSTANFLRGSWLSSHTSSSGVNKCLVWGGAARYDNFLYWNHHHDAEMRKKQQKINGIRRVGGEIRKHINQEKNAPFVFLWRTAEEMVAINDATPGCATDWGNVAFFSPLWCFLGSSVQHITKRQSFNKLVGNSFTDEAPPIGNSIGLTNGENGERDMHRKINQKNKNKMRQRCQGFVVSVLNTTVN